MSCWCTVLWISAPPSSVGGRCAVVGEGRREPSAWSSPLCLPMNILFKVSPLVAKKRLMWDVLQRLLAQCLMSVQDITHVNASYRSPPINLTLLRLPSPYLRRRPLTHHRKREGGLYHTVEQRQLQASIEHLN